MGDTENLNALVNEIEEAKEPVKKLENVKPLPKAEVPIMTKEEIKEEIKEKVEVFNKELEKNENTKDYKLVNRNLIIAGYLLAGIFLMIMLIGMIWGNYSLGKFANKDLSTVVNNNIESQNVSIPVNVTNQETNTYPIYNNITINFPEEMTIKYLNHS